MAATGTETSGMQASCKSTEQTRNTQDRLPTSLSLLYSRVKGHGVPPLRAKAAKHCHKTPQSFTTEEKTGGGGKTAHHSFSITFPPLGFYKVILAHDARRDTLQHRRSRALPDHHTHEIQQHKSRTTFFYRSKKRREGGTL